jgi:hypothetical protein
MARKLYIFNPSGRVKMDGRTAKWLGGYTSTYVYLGDFEARMLGVGNYLSIKRLPAWLHNQPAGSTVVKGGASRLDRSFRGWG